MHYQSKVRQKCEQPSMRRSFYMLCSVMTATSLINWTLQTQTCEQCAFMHVRTLMLLQYAGECAYSHASAVCRRMCVLSCLCSVQANVRTLMLLQYVVECAYSHDSAVCRRRECAYPHASAACRRMCVFSCQCSVQANVRTLMLVQYASECAQSQASAACKRMSLLVLKLVQYASECAPCGFGGSEFSQRCPCACRKRRLIIGYKLSYTTAAYCMLGLLACSEAYEFGQLGTGFSWFM